MLLQGYIIQQIMAQAASTECSNGEISPIESNPSLDVDARPITSFAHGDSEVHEAYPNATDDSRRSIDSPGGHSCSISKGSMKYVETTASTCSGHEMNENNVGDAGSRFDHIRTYFKRADGYTWTTAFIRDGPLLGIAALLFVLLSIPAAAIVLAVSDGQAVEKWKVQPNVFLSIFTGIGNKALAFAAAEGAIVTWWVSAPLFSYSTSLRSRLTIHRYELFTARHFETFITTGPLVPISWALSVLSVLGY